MEINLLNINKRLEELKSRLNSQGETLTKFNKWMMDFEERIKLIERFIESEFVDFCKTKDGTGTTPTVCETCNKYKTCKGKEENCRSYEPKHEQCELHKTDNANCPQCARIRSQKREPWKPKGYDCDGTQLTENNEVKTFTQYHFRTQTEAELFLSKIKKLREEMSE